MLTVPPVGVDDGDLQRVDEARFRRRLLDSMHRADARLALVARFGLDRSEDISDQSIAWWLNIYPGLFASMSGLYTQPPRVMGPDGCDGTLKALRQHWAEGQVLQRNTLALNESFKVVDRVGDKVVYHTIWPDYFDRLACKTDDPACVGRIRVWIHLGGNRFETREWDINDGPTFTRGQWGGKGPVEVIETLAGPAYPYIGLDGEPYIPGVMYHAELTGNVINWERGSDVAFGCLAVTIDFTSAEHAHTEASWRQRYIGNLEPAAGVSIDNEQGGADNAAPRVVKADPRSLLELHTPQGSEGKQPLVGTFEAPTDPEALLRFCATIAQRLMASAGLRNVDVLKNSADIRSGISLTVSREEQSALQLTFKAPFGRADAELAHKTAIALGEPSTECDDWSIRYRPIRASAAEMRARLDVCVPAIQAGLMSRMEAMMTMYPELNEEEAHELIEEIDAERTPPTPAAPGATATTPTEPAAPSDPAEPGDMSTTED